MEDEVQTSRPRVNRMLIASFALIGLFISLYLALHKYGYIGTLMCGESGSCEIVQTSKWAVLFGVPVSVLGLIGYLVILVVALLGLQPSFGEKRALAGSLLLLTTGAFGFSLYLSYLEQFVIHAWCRWCIGSAVVAILMWLFALAELPRLRRTA